MLSSFLQAKCDLGHMWRRQAWTALNSPLNRSATWFYTFFLSLFLIVLNISFHCAVWWFPAQWKALWGMKGQGCFPLWTHLKGAATSVGFGSTRRRREREVIKQRSHYACNCNERSICHISHKIISSAALSKYLTGANKWKIIAKCPGTPNFIHLFFFIWERFGALMAAERKP